VDYGLSVIVHFINDDYELKTRCLQTAYFTSEHTGENIACSLREFLSRWHLNEKGQTCITTDNAENVAQVVEINEWARQCFGHRLHLAIGIVM